MAKTILKRAKTLEKLNFGILRSKTVFSVKPYICTAGRSTSPVVTQKTTSVTQATSLIFHDATKSVITRRKKVLH
jgi:hypothetical protein